MKKNILPAYFGITFTGALILCIDVLTKIWAKNHLKQGIMLTKNIGLMYTTNTGAGFSLLTKHNMLLAWFSIIIIGILIFFYPDLPANLRTPVYLFIIGGLGNVIDRFIYGHVIDFIKIGWWPSFNIADITLCIAAGWIILKLLKKNCTNTVI